MTFDPDAAYQAIVARDARFDGRLFVGVTSTGVYCRPICRVRVPMRKNCRFFETPAQAEAAAFRPCMKCRPEIAPGPGLPWTVMDSSRTLAHQAATALDADAANGDCPSVAVLAQRLGVSDRHLRRIFVAEHGVTPLQYVQTRRLLLAKHLLTDTRLSVSQVALTSGFRSLRRFNAAFADSYRMNPARLRKDAASPADHRMTASGTRTKASTRASTSTNMSASASASTGTGISAGTGMNASGSADHDDAVSVSLGYRAPYDIDSLLRFMAVRAIPGVESVEGLTIRRTLRAGTVAPVAGWIEATFLPERSRVRLTRPWPIYPAPPACDCPAVSTAWSSPSAPCSASRSPWPPRARSQADSSTASAHR
jgi:AraC family transcriptional regulator of adaptative response / DNA-3-methyladenine glycosylase II